VGNVKAAEVSARYQDADRLLYRMQSQLVTPLIPELSVYVDSHIHFFFSSTEETLSFSHFSMIYSITQLNIF
jgi:hypothetical protein